MCGDSTKAEDVQKLMDGKKANLCITDPPYGIAIGTGAAYQNAKTDRTIMNDNLPDDAFIEFLVKAFSNMKNSLIPGGVFYIWYASSKSLVFLKALEQAELTMRQNLIGQKVQPINFLTTESNPLCFILTDRKRLSCTAP